MRLSPSDSRKRSSSSTRTICGGGTAALSMLVDELLKTALGALLDNVIASDFIVESPHYPVLKVEVKIDVDFAILAGIVPDRGRRRLGPGSRRAERRGRRDVRLGHRLGRRGRGRRLQKGAGGEAECARKARRHGKPPPFDRPAFRLHRPCIAAPSLVGPSTLVASH